jgi:hypothetical protein
MVGMARGVDLVRTTVVQCSELVEGRGMKQAFRRRGGVLKSAAVFTLGAAVGSIAALLYAPASGKQTRRRIAMRVQTLRRETGRRLGRTGRALATQAVQVREAATDWISEHIPHGNGNGRQVRRPAARHA